MYDWNFKCGLPYLLAYRTADGDEGIGDFLFMGIDNTSRYVFKKGEWVSANDDDLTLLDTRPVRLLKDEILLVDDPDGDVRITYFEDAAAMER